MTVYDEVERDDMTWEVEGGAFFFRCPCGDRFTISIQQLLAGEDIAECPSCDLKIRVIFQKEDLVTFENEARAEGIVC